MKIFISHSSKNSHYGDALVKLLSGLGVAHENIIFTSDSSYGIPAGEKIFDWLKTRIAEKPFVIYLLSPEYYASVACLNEMGAAWIVENQHAMIFTPEFDLNSDNFKDGALDPREMGFFLNNQDRVIEFVERIRPIFGLSANAVITHKLIAAFLKEVGDAQEINRSTKASQIGIETKKNSVSAVKIVPKGPSLVIPGKTIQTPAQRYFLDLANGKLKDEEVMVVHYAVDTARHSLGVGWRVDEEKGRIRDWEELNDLGDVLSKNYENAIRWLDVRKLTSVSETTSSGNPRQVAFDGELKDKFLDMPQEFFDKSAEIVARSLETLAKPTIDDFPF